MRRWRRLSRVASTIVVLTTAVVLSVATLGGVSSAGEEKPPADDIGITDDEIRLAVIADVENSLVPGLFQASVDGMEAWARWVNKQGGIAGREVVIDFIDSHLSPDDARNAVIQACAEDFALVGGQALFLNNVDDMVACPDKNGQPTGIPDIPGLALEPAQKCSGITFVATGDQEFCDTRDQRPQTYYPFQGDFRWYLKENKDLHGIFAVPNDLKSTRDSIIPMVEAAMELGIRPDGEGMYNTSARQPQSAITPLIQVVKENGSNFVYNGNAPTVMVYLRKEAKLQGVDSVDVWACHQGCYTQEFLDQGGPDVEGTYSITYTLPFYSEPRKNPTLRALLKELGADVEDMNANGIAAWVAGLLFQRAANEVVDSGETLTRATLLDALRNIHDFDANGIMGPTDVGNHKASECFVISQVQNGKWKRVYPKKPGTFDCSKQNKTSIQLDLLE